MFDALATKAFDMAKDAAVGPVYAAQIQMLGEHINYLQAQLEDTKTKLIKVETLLDERNQEILELRHKLDSLDGSAKFTDIGPCLVKQSRDGILLRGVYCCHCKSLLEKGDFGYGNYPSWEFLCEKCNLRIGAEVIEHALNDFCKKSGLSQPA